MPLCNLKRQKIKKIKKSQNKPAFFNKSQKKPKKAGGPAFFLKKKPGFLQPWTKDRWFFQAIEIIAYLYC